MNKQTEERIKEIESRAGSPMKHLPEIISTVLRGTLQDNPGAACFVCGRFQESADIETATAVERERCAKIADDLAEECGYTEEAMKGAYVTVADKIRSRAL